MKKTILLTFGLFTALSLVGCSSVQTKAADEAPLHKVHDTKTVLAKAQPAHDGVEIHLAATQVKPIQNDVQVKSSYYNYDASSFNPEERKALLEILNYLKQTEELIKYAHSQQNDDQRIKFRYDWLSNDLYKVERGIQDYITTPQSQPRTVTPIMGTYSR